MAEIDIDISVDDALTAASHPVLRHPSLTGMRNPSFTGLKHSSLSEADAVSSEDVVVRDYKGNPFNLPVDADHKSRALAICSCPQPHMVAFHLAWTSFFTCFMAVFAAAPMVPVIREDLSLTQVSIGVSGVASVTGTVFSRIFIGSLCDIIGPRFAFAGLLLLTAPAVFCMAVVSDSLGYIIVRFIIGFSLASFVVCQFWCSVMFSNNVVAFSNATAAGWGNLGGGITQLLMPLLFSGMTNVLEPFLAWRWVFLVPASAMLIAGVSCLIFGQDLPDGQYSELKQAGLIPKANVTGIALAACRNYRTWILAMNYGLCFGVELTMQNLVTPYFYDQFNLPLSAAGLLGSLFGLMNLFARALGGFASDKISVGRYRMRGRLWVFWILQMAEGSFCVLLGLVHKSLGATVFVLVLFSLFVQAAEGACFGLVPFVSKRSLGLVSGLVGAGGNAGSVILQSLFFVSGALETHQGLLGMGLVILVGTQTICLIRFPMWGGMFHEPYEGADENEYYDKEFSKHEKAGGLRSAVLKFANSSMTQLQFAAKLQAEEDVGIHPPLGLSPSSGVSNVAPCTTSGVHLEIDTS